MPIWTQRRRSREVQVVQRTRTASLGAAIYRNILIIRFSFRKRKNMRRHFWISTRAAAILVRPLQGRHAPIQYADKKTNNFSHKLNKTSFITHLSFPKFFSKFLVVLKQIVNLNLCSSCFKSYYIYILNF